MRRIEPAAMIRYKKISINKYKVFFRFNLFLNMSCALGECKIHSHKAKATKGKPRDRNLSM